MEKYKILNDLKYSPDGCHVVVYLKDDIVETDNQKFIKIFTQTGEIELINEPVKKEIPENKMEVVSENKVIAKKKVYKKKRKKK